MLILFLLEAKKNFFRRIIYALKGRQGTDMSASIFNIFFQRICQHCKAKEMKIEQTYPNMISLSSCRDFVLVARTYVSLCYSRHFTIVYLSISTWNIW
jgi:hypothetical protein